MPLWGSALRVKKVTATPTPPSAGELSLYPKSDNRWYLETPSDLPVRELLASQEFPMLAPVRLATFLDNITLSGTPMVDGIQSAVGDRVLARSQSALPTNGVYVVAAGAWSRAPDADNNHELMRGTQVAVTEGLNDRSKVFTLMADVTAVGTTDQVWRVLTYVDGAGSFFPPPPQSFGHLFYNLTDKVLTVWDGGWRKLNGWILCTSTTRPSFGIGNETMIYETDTKNCYIFRAGSWEPLGTISVEGGGVPLAAPVNRLDFTGPGVSVAAGEAGEATVTISGGGGGTQYGNLPVGAVVPYGGATAPSGFLMCDGSAVSRTTYPDLFTAIGTAYGVGDGTLTFNVPNLKGRVPVGKDAAQTEFDVLGETGGEKAHVQTVAEMAVHSHGLTQTYVTAGGVGVANITYSTTSANTGPAGSGAAMNNLQPYQVTNYIIRAVPTAGESVTAPAWRSLTCTNLLLPGSGTLVPFTTDQGGSGITASGGRMTIATAGVYHVAASVGVSGSSNVFCIVDLIHKRGGTQIGVREVVGSTSATGNYDVATVLGDFNCLPGDTFEVTASPQSANVVTVSVDRSQFVAHMLGGGGGSGGSGGPDEVWVGAEAPTESLTELWYDTDEVGSVPATTDTGWINMTLLNGWLNYDSNVATGGAGRCAQYRKVNGVVSLRGVIKAGPAGQIALLPVGFRPGHVGTTADSHFACVANSAFAAVGIGSVGNLNYIVGSNVWFDISGVSYLADY